MLSTAYINYSQSILPTSDVNADSSERINIRLSPKFFIILTYSQVHIRTNLQKPMGRVDNPIQWFKFDCRLIHFPSIGLQSTGFSRLFILRP